MNSAKSHPGIFPPVSDLPPEALRWNACIQLLAGPFEALNPIQRQAAVVFRYDGWVQNGGHGLVFDAITAAWREALPDALKALGAMPQLRIFNEASILESEARDAEADGDEGTADQIAEMISALDRQYGSLDPDVPELLKRYFNTHPAEFPT